MKSISLEAKEELLEQIEFFKQSIIDLPITDPIPVPTPIPDPIPGEKLLIRPSYWFEGGYGTLPQNPGSANYFTKASSPSNVFGTHWRVPPWTEPVWEHGKITSWVNETSKKKFTGVCTDVEGPFWYASGYLDLWKSVCQTYDMPMILAVKASLRELSGNPHVDVGVAEVRAHLEFYKHINPYGFMPWMYGSHQVHLEAHKALVNFGVSPRRIILLHDHFRMQINGYIGLIEFPHLISWAKQDPLTRLIGAFQAHADIDKSRLVNIIKQLDNVYN
jgi:hypothetical protein